MTLPGTYLNVEEKYAIHRSTVQVLPSTSSNYLFRCSSKVPLVPRKWQEETRKFLIQVAYTFYFLKIKQFNSGSLFPKTLFHSCQIHIRNMTSPTFIKTASFSFRQISFLFKQKIQVGRSVGEIFKKIGKSLPTFSIFCLTSFIELEDEYIMIQL
jgi:hypothetical protein